jgi:Amt family ammonium transporter
MWGEKFVERTLKVDDAVGAVTVHGICGFLGLLMVGIFADGTYAGISGLIVGNVGQFVTQLIGAVTLAAWGLIMGFIIFSFIKATTGLRVTDEEQSLGLDITEHGVAAYETPIAAGVAAAAD